MRRIGIGRSVAVLLSFFMVSWIPPAVAQNEDVSLSTVLEKGVLRVCADKWALPFSGDAPSAPGIGLEIADIMARRLNVRLEYVWLDTGARGGAIPMLRDTLLGKRCDCFVGLPVKVATYLDGLEVTEPFLGTAFAMVIPQGAEPIKVFDEVRGKKVGAASNSPPWKVLYDMGLEISYAYRDNEEIIEAVEKGEIEIGFVWGPAAGWFLKQNPEHKVQLVSAHDLLPRLRGEPVVYNIGVALRKTDVTLKNALSQAMKEIIDSGKLEEIVTRYGVPYLPPFKLEE